MIHRPQADNAFEFVRLASLRAAQLMRGCTRRVPGTSKAIVAAQQEVASGLVRALEREDTAPAKRGANGHGR